MGNLRCRWVRDRLPLMVDEELRGLDRRRVERHLIGCPRCRQQQAALGQAFETLRNVAASAIAPPDAPSLWPALARQIRESRRPAPTPTFPFAWALAWPRANPWPAFGLALGLLATLVVGVGVRRQITVSQAHMAINESPITSIPGPHKSRLVARPVPGPAPRRETPAPIEIPVVESAPAAPRLDFDLDHGRPMSPETRDARDPRDANTY